MADRIAEICIFLQAQWPHGEFQLDPISGDASFRRYFRVTTASTSYVLMDAPPNLEDSQRFIAICQAYAAAGLVVPTVIAAEPARGLLLLSDLGDALLQHQLSEDTVEQWYRQALGLLPAVRQVQSSASGALPAFDRAFLQRELMLFNEWFLTKHLAITPSTEIAAMLNQAFDLICDAALSQVQAGMHRDFHSRNLMVQTPQQLAVIDFQDAVIGPVTYDAVSLLKDCYVMWPTALIDSLRNEFLQQLQQQGVLPAHYDSQRFQQDFDWMGLQRHLKVLGIFCRLWYRDGKSGYLADLPRVFQYVVQTCEHYPEFSALATWLRQEVEPALVRSLA